MVGIIRPHCSQAARVILSGFNRGGSQKMHCKACRKTFTPSPTPHVVTADKA